MKTSILKQPHTLSISAVALAVLLALPAAQADTLEARLDRNSISTGDTVTLSIELPANTAAQPDLSPLRQDFDILGSSNSTQVQIINGNTSQNKQLNITLASHGTGNISIPALKVGADETTPLQLSVRDAPITDSSKAGNPVWMEMATSLTDKQHNVTVQQEIPLTVRLYSAIPLHDVRLNPPAPAGATVEKLDQDKQYQTERNGQTYQVLEQHYAVFPEQPGNLDIPPVTLRAVTPDPNQAQRGSGSGNSAFNDDFFRDAFRNSPLAQQMLNDDFFNDPFGMMNSGKPVNLRSNSLQFNVGHIPAAAQGKTWLPARKVSLSDSWQNNPPRLRTGEPSTLTLTVTADGLTGEQIPAIILPDIPGVRVYSEPAQAESRTNGEQVTGTSTQTFTLIPEQTGEVKLPAISLPWWNTQTQTPQTAELPGRTLNIAQGSGSSAAPPAASLPAAPSASMTPAPTRTTSDNSSSSQPAWLTRSGIELAGTALLAALLATGVYWRRRHPQQASFDSLQASEYNPGKLATSGITHCTVPSRQLLDNARTKCLQSCAADDPYLSAKTLLEWARLAWPEQPPTSLPALAARLEGKLRAEIRVLHQYIYQSTQNKMPWSGSALADALQQGLKPKPEKQATYHNPGLPPLYPA